MALPRIFSRRQREQETKNNDVFNYADLPTKIRVQIIHIWNDVIGAYYSGDSYASVRPAIVFDAIVDMAKKEMGVFKLSSKFSNNSQEDLYQWFLEETDLNALLDVVEYAFRVIDTYIRNHEYNYRKYSKITPDLAIMELNDRLREASIGYQYIKGDIVKMDTEYSHQEIVLPALNLLSDEKFKGPNSEFREAHRLFRSKQYEQSITECCKSFESVLKVIAVQRKWKVSQNDPASKLLAAAFDNGLFPPYFSTSFSSLRSLLYLLSLWCEINLRVTVRERKLGMCRNILHLFR